MKKADFLSCSDDGPRFGLRDPHRIAVNAGMGGTRGNVWLLRHPPAHDRWRATCGSRHPGGLRPNESRTRWCVVLHGFGPYSGTIRGRALYGSPPWSMIKDLVTASARRHPRLKTAIGSGSVHGHFAATRDDAVDDGGPLDLSGAADRRSKTDLQHATRNACT